MFRPGSSRSTSRRRRNTSSVRSRPVDPRGDQQDRNRVRNAAHETSSAGARMDAVHARNLDRLGNRRQRRRHQRPVQPVGSRDLRGRPLPSKRQEHPVTGTTRSSPITTPSGTSKMSSATQRSSMSHQDRRRLPRSLPGKPLPNEAGWPNVQGKPAGDALHLPYVWGGSHGISPIPASARDFDQAPLHLASSCVGGTHAPTMTTMGLLEWGKPGPARRDYLRQRRPHLPRVSIRPIRTPLLGHLRMRPSGFTGPGWIAKENPHPATSPPSRNDTRRVYEPFQSKRRPRPGRERGTTTPEEMSPRPNRSP